MVFRTSLRHDFFGGVTAAVVALPLALAFGVASGVGPLAGLYGAIFAGFFAAIFGGTRVQVTGPTGPMTVVMALVVTHFSGNLSTAFSVVILAGLFQILFGKLGIGRFIKLVPQPVVSGFMTGIGIIIIIIQIGPVLGQVTPSGAILEKLANTSDLLLATNLNAALLAAGVLAVMMFIPERLEKILPSALLVLLVGTAITSIFSVDVPLIGEIPTGIPTILVPEISIADIPYIVRFALVLAFLGSIDSLLTSIVVDSLTRSAHDSNKELFGQGLGNIASGLFGGLPSAGATMRTLINVRAGGRTRLSGVLHSVILFAIVLGFGQSVSLIPLPVLAGILVKVGIDIIDWEYLKRLRHAPRSDLAIMLSTLILTIFVDLITAVAVGFVMASVLFVAKLAETQVKNARFSYGADDIENLSIEERELMDKCHGRLVLFHVEGPLSFGSARDVARLMHSGIDKGVLVIDMRDVPFIDSSACAALEEVAKRIHDDGDILLLFGVREVVKSMLTRTGVTLHIGEDNMLAARIDALKFANDAINGND